MSNQAKTDKKNRLLFKLVGSLTFTIIGILFIVFLPKEEPYKDFFLAVSASVMAVGLTGILSAYIDRSIDSDLFHYISILEDERLTSEESEALTFFRKRWHCYHLTVRSKTRNWVYTTLDFSAKIPGQLVGTTYHKPTNSTYHIRAFLRRDKFVMAHTASSGALMSPSISTFPNCTTYGTKHSGVMQHVDYDGKQRLDPIIISSEPLVLDLPEGSFFPADSKIYSELLELWKEDAGMEGLCASLAEAFK